jgi:hypothetical protein
MARLLRNAHARLIELTTYNSQLTTLERAGASRLIDVMALQRTKRYDWPNAINKLASGSAFLSCRL